MGCGTFRGTRDGGIRNFDVGDIGPGLTSAGACLDYVAITVASLAGGLHLVGAWGILERAVVGEGRGVFPAIGNLVDIAVSFIPSVMGILRLFGFAVNQKMDFDRDVACLAGTGIVETIGSTPAVDARDVRLLGAGRREIRDPCEAVVGHAKETRDGADVLDIES